MEKSLSVGEKITINSNSDDKYTVRAKSKSGLTSAESLPFTVKVLKSITPPEIVVTGTPTNNWYTGEVALSATQSQEIGKEIIKLQYKTDDGTWQDEIPTVLEGTHTYYA